MQQILPMPSVQCLEASFLRERTRRVGHSYVSVKQHEETETMELIRKGSFEKQLQSIMIIKNVIIDSNYF